MLEEIKAVVCIPVKHGVCLMDYADFKALNGRNIHSSVKRYAAVSIKQKDYYIHRMLMNPPSHLRVDHINGNGFDNRRKNLRICTHRENLQNRNHTKRSASGYKGVYRHSQATHLWTASIKTETRKIHLGMFKTAESAAQAYNEAAIKHFGQYAKLNIIKG